MANLIPVLRNPLLFLLLIPAAMFGQQSSTPQKNNSAREAVAPQRSSSERQQLKQESIVREEASQPVSAGIKERTILDLPGYPKYVVTENPEQDEKNYQLAKAKWMDENPELYRKYLREASAGFDRSSQPLRQDHSNR